jgi:hypothetical protein
MKIYYLHVLFFFDLVGIIGLTIYSSLSVQQYTFVIKKSIVERFYESSIIRID